MNFIWSGYDVYFNTPPTALITIFNTLNEKFDKEINFAVKIYFFDYLL